MISCLYKLYKIKISDITKTVYGGADAFSSLLSRCISLLLDLLKPQDAQKRCVKSSGYVFRTRLGCNGSDHSWTDALPIEVSPMC